MRQRRIRDIVIELTSLLDVVMILIFAVMIENSKLVKAGQEELTLANGTIEQMQSDLADAEIEKERLCEEFSNDLQKKQSELDDTKNELNKAEAAAKEASEQLENANEALDLVKTEKDEISEELKVALRKLSEGDIDELLKRIENAELKNKGYEYMDKLVVVYNVGIESFYENDEAEAPLYRTLSFGRAGTKKEDVFFEFRSSDERAVCISEMKIKLMQGIDKALENDDVSVFLVFSYYGGEKTLYVDRIRIEEALGDITGKYKGDVSYRINVMEDK